MKKSLKITLVCAITAVILLITILTIRHLTRPATLILQVSPSSANITINGTTYHNGSYEINPGEDISTTISAEGFTTKTISLSLSRGHTTSLITYLRPEDGSWNYYLKEENRESLNILANMLGLQPPSYVATKDNITTDNDSSAASFVKTLSIGSILPTNLSICGEPATRLNCDSIDISLAYSKDCNDTLCLIITGRRDSLDNETLSKIAARLQESGYQLKDYKYTYASRDN